MVVEPRHSMVEDEEKPIHFREVFSCQKRKLPKEDKGFPFYFAYSATFIFEQQINETCQNHEFQLALKNGGNIQMQRWSRILLEILLRFSTLSCEKLDNSSLPDTYCESKMLE